VLVDALPCSWQYADTYGWPAWRAVVADGGEVLSDLVPGECGEGPLPRQGRRRQRRCERLQWVPSIPQREMCLLLVQNHDGIKRDCELSIYLYSLLI